MNELEEKPALLLNLSVGPPIRVCDECFQSIRDYQYRRLRGEDTAVEIQDWQETVQEIRAGMAAWYYLFYPFATEHKVGYATICVRVREAMHLPGKINYYHIWTVFLK